MEGTNNTQMTDMEADVPVFKGWENKTISGTLDNMHKVPQTLPVEFRFRSILHHKIADGAATIKGYKKLEEMVKQHQIPKTILLRTRTKNERACSVSRTRCVPIYVDHFDAGLCFPLPGLIFDILAEYELVLTQLTPNSIKFIIGFMLLCAKLEIPAKAIVFRNKVARWKKQFIFIRDMRTERMNNELAARISKWHAEGLVDLDALVTPEQLVMFGFVDVANLYTEGEMSSVLERQRERAQHSRGRQGEGSSHRSTRFDKQPPAASPRSLSQRERDSQRRARDDSNVEDDVPLIRRRTSSMAQPVLLAATRSSNVPFSSACDVAKALPTSTSASSPRIAYPEGFNYTRTDYQAATVQAMLSFVPPVDPQRAKGYIQQNGGHATMLKLMDMKPSRVDELANKVNELKEKLERARAEKESGILAAKDEVDRVEEHAMKAKVERNTALDELNSLRHWIAAVNESLAHAEESLNSVKKSYQHSISIARAQGTKWLVGSDMFQDVMAIASMNTTRQIYDKIDGKVLQHRPDFHIGELAFFEGKEIDEQGKSLALSADTTVRLRWELNEDGVPVWPPSVLKDGEDANGLPSYDAWVAGVPVWPPSVLEDGEDAKGLPSYDAWVARVPELQAEPTTTPSNSQLAVTSIRSSPARADASAPVHLTKD
ncbi:hypothetical protein SLEP1_g55867 [Rubroshorea leprosula]|uniref:Transposase (putative) gypsy type domain-containing protein n=1 Tax=Rubroshorea leprosula TaxID=152421 RepID=A0AAV5MH31_9ROSI|nr:hypothetical protein SLEP1_g55867 [Rubroshorea leprosula]